MQTLAQILAGVGGNPYQQSEGASIAPSLLQQALLSQQQNAAQQGQMGQPTGVATQQPTMMGLGSLGGLGNAAMPGIIPGAY